MTLSVKPFGCMPSAGVSDGVQSAITEKFPGTIFCPVETSGDGRVNFYSRVQMYLFKAKQRRPQELERVCDEHGVTREQVRRSSTRTRASAARSTRRRTPPRARRADLVAEIAPLITQSASTRFVAKSKKTVAAVKSAGPAVAKRAKDVYANRTEYWQLAKEDLAVVREVLEGKLGEEWMRIGKTLLKHDEVHEAHDRVGTVPVVAAAE